LAILALTASSVLLSLFTSLKKFLSPALLVLTIYPNSRHQPKQLQIQHQTPQQRHQRHRSWHLQKFLSPALSVLTICLMADAIMPDFLMSSAIFTLPAFSKSTG
jgi:hypothetical protein